MGKQILTDLEVKGYIDVDGGIKDSGGDMGNSGQFLQTTGSDVNWASAPGSSGNSTFVGKWTKEITWGTAQTGVSFSGANDYLCSLTHNLATESVVASVKDISGSSGYSDNDLHMDIGADAFIEVNSPNVCRLEITPPGSSGYPDTGDQFLVTIIG
jgi:hypothetical protein